MNQPMNLPLPDADPMDFTGEGTGQSTTDEFLDGRQEGLYEACLIMDRIARDFDAEPAALAALQAARAALRESIHTTEASDIRARVMALVTAAQGRDEP